MEPIKPNEEKLPEKNELFWLLTLILAKCILAVAY